MRLNCTQQGRSVVLTSLSTAARLLSIIPPTALVQIETMACPLIEKGKDILAVKMLDESGRQAQNIAERFEHAWVMIRPGDRADLISARTSDQEWSCYLLGGRLHVECQTDDLGEPSINPADAQSARQILSTLADIAGVPVTPIAYALLGGKIPSDSGGKSPKTLKLKVRQT